MFDQKQHQSVRNVIIWYQRCFKAKVKQISSYGIRCLPAKMLSLSLWAIRIFSKIDWLRPLGKIAIIHPNDLWFENGLIYSTRVTTMSFRELFWLTHSSSTVLTRFVLLIRIIFTDSCCSYFPGRRRKSFFAINEFWFGEFAREYIV